MKKYFNKLYSFILCLLFLFTIQNVNAIQEENQQGVDKPDTLLEKLTLYVHEGLGDSQKGLKNSKIVTTSDHQSEVRVKELSDTAGYYYLIIPSIQNKNEFSYEISVPAEVLTALDSIQLFEIKPFLEATQRANENDYLFKLGVMKTFEKWLKEQERIKHTEAIVNLLWIILFIIGLRRLKVTDAKDDRLRSSLWSLIVVASVILFIISLPNIICYL